MGPRTFRRCSLAPRIRSEHTTAPKFRNYLKFHNFLQGIPFSRFLVLTEWRVILILWKPDSAGPCGAFLVNDIAGVDPGGKDEDGYETNANRGREEEILNKKASHGKCRTF